MDRNQILAEVQDIFCDILDNEDLVLLEETTANDIEEWDSLSHVQLVVAVEKHFDMRFTSEEIMNMANVGEMINTIIAKKL